LPFNVNPNQIPARGTVVEILEDEVYRVELANGHRCIAHVSREQSLNAVPLGLGESVHLEFHPYDLSRGRIVVKKNA
jgi:translation initiation factor IF-1